MIAFGYCIVAQRCAHVLRVRHRLDARRVDRLQLVDQREDRVELRVDVARSRLVDVDSREMRDPQYVVDGERHGSGERSTAARLRRLFKTTGPGAQHRAEVVIKPHQISAKATANRLS